MKWIKYKILQCIVDELPVFIEKKVGHSEENLTIAQSEAYNKEYTIEEDSEETFEAPFFKTGLGKLLCDSGNESTSIFTDDVVEIPGIQDYTIFGVYIHNMVADGMLICTKAGSGVRSDTISGCAYLKGSSSTYDFKFTGKLNGNNLTCVELKVTATKDSDSSVSNIGGQVHKIVGII